jgi:sugar/nucleoside kinase (ribokinase family)
LFAGLATLDLVYGVDALPRGNGKVVAERQIIAAGGPAANAAVAHAVLGGRSWLVTRLGDHPLARLARADLEAHGVEVLDLCPDHVGPPPVSSIMSAGAQRAVVSVNGAAFDADEERRQPDPGPLLEDCAVLVLDGHHPDLAIPVAARARERRIPVLLDAGSWKPAAEPLLALATVVLCSADFRIPGVAREKTLEALLDRGAGWAGISAGEGPIHWSSRTGGGHVPVPAVDVVDTLGAGDILHGALAYGLATQPRADPPSLLAAASEVASNSCRHFGTRDWIRG